MSRSTWKGPYIEKTCLQKIFTHTVVGNDSLNLWSKQSTILPITIGAQINLYTGKEFLKLKITEEMVGHKFGEFVSTRKKFIYKKKKKNNYGPKN